MNSTMVYDIHAHIIPPGLIDTLRRDGDRYDIEIVVDDGSPRAIVAGRVTTGPLREDLVDIDTRRDTMDRMGVTTQILSSFIDLTAYALSPDAGIRYSRMVNEELAAVAESDPGRFKVLGTVPLQNPEEAGIELRRSVVELGMVGVEIATTVDGTDLDDRALDPFWAIAAELRCLVLLHPHASLEGRAPGRYFLSNIVGNPAETTIAVAHLVFGGVLERHPALRVCAVHGGGFTPYQIGRWDRGYAAKAELTAVQLTRSPQEWAQSLFYDTVTHSPEALAFLVDSVGADHVLLGSDYPFEMGDPNPVETVEAAPGLDQTQRHQILAGNVEHLLSEVRR